jgi:hypothetical protein
MSRPKAHYSMIVKNHVSGDRLKVETLGSCRGAVMCAAMCTKRPKT